MASCGRETETLDEANFGYDYFPLSTGKTWIYQSDSVIFTKGGTKRDTFRSFIQEQIGEKYTGQDGAEKYRVYRSFRRKNSDLWTPINTWTTSIDATRAIRTEENLTFIKLVFPFKKGLRWEGNAFVDPDTRIEVGGENIQAYADWKHRIDEVELDYTFNNQKVKAVKVNLVSDTSLIDLRKVTEYYGRSVGLLRKEVAIFDANQDLINLTWDKKIQKGFTHTLTLIEVR
jgi:hypothetical protein